MSWIWRLNDTTNYSTFDLAQTAGTDGDTIDVSPALTGGSLQLQENVNITKGFFLNFTVRGMTIIGVAVNVFSWNPTAGSTLHVTGLTIDLGEDQTTASVLAATSIFTNCFFRVKYITLGVDAVTRFYNCSFMGIGGSTTNFSIFGNTRFYHCAFVAVGQNIISNGTTKLIDIFNCVLMSPTPILYNSGVLSQDNNITMLATTEGGVGGAGANNTIATPLEAGLLCATTGMSFDYRILASSEVAGVTTANGVDLTAISQLDNDIDGRSRAIYGYKIGISCGYDVIQNADIPALENVLNTDTAGGESGLWHPAISTNNLYETYYGVSGVSESGSWQQAPSAAVLYDNFYGVSGVSESGSAVYPAASDVRYNVVVGAETGTAYIPIASNVRENVPVDNTVGTVHIPVIDPNHVLFGVDF